MTAAYTTPIEMTQIRRPVMGYSQKLHRYIVYKLILRLLQRFFIEKY